MAVCKLMSVYWIFSISKSSIEGSHSLKSNNLDDGMVGFLVSFQFIRRINLIALNQDLQQKDCEARWQVAFDSNRLCFDFDVNSAATLN